MDDVTVMVTGSGAPGVLGTLYSLKNNFDNRKIRIVGTDIKKEVVGRYLCDAFYPIPPPNHPDYIPALLKICKKERVQVILPQNTRELLVLSQVLDRFTEENVSIAVSGASAIETANNKYLLMQQAKKIGIPTPAFSLVESFDDLVVKAQKMGWPEKPVVVKPPDSNGSRGVRIIDESVDLQKKFYDEKPGSLTVKMHHLKELIGETFPPLIVMEYLPGKEYTIDVLHHDSFTIVPRTRDEMKSGITFSGTTEKNNQLIEYSEKLSNHLNLIYAFGFQFKYGGDQIPKLLESNPRIQGTMVLSTFAGANIIYGAVKAALSEPVPPFEIRWNTRIIRYWGGIGLFNNAVVGSL